MKDPFGLEPKNGDYTAYLEALQAGKIRNLDPLKAPGSASSDTDLAVSIAKSELPLPKDLPQSRPQYEQTSVSQTFPQNTPASETAQERLKRRAAEQNRQRRAGPLAALSAFAGFGCFIAGGILETEWLIFLGMAITVLGFRAAANADSRNKRR